LHRSGSCQLAEAILAMVGSLAMALSRPDHLYRQQASPRRVRANAGRNVVLGLTFLFALALVVNGLLAL
jgi:hypothetical protein